jgi:hypothetical protein
MLDCEANKRPAGIIADLNLEHQAGDQSSQVDVQEQAGIVNEIENGHGVAATQLQPPVAREVKCAWGTMWTCHPLECADGTMLYSSFKPAVPQPDGIPRQQAHTMPSLLRKDPNKHPFQYVALLKDIQATCASGSVSVMGNGAVESVFMPYRPVGRHG